MANFTGGAGDDTLNGTQGIDEIDLSQGGHDTVNALQGDDTFIAGAAFDALDRLQGHNGYDRLLLAGDYSTGVTFESLTVRNIEEIAFAGGYDYKLITHNGTVAAGQILKVDAYSVSAGKSLYFDGSAEKDGSFLFYDGQSNDTFYGGALSDTISLAYGGNDKVYGGGGGDVITVYDSLTSADIIDGQAGNDVLYLWGDYSQGLTFTATTVKNIETLGVVGSFGYNIAIVDETVAAGENLYVTAEGIGGAGCLYFNGLAETDGTLSFKDSIANDILYGGAQDDVFFTSFGGHDLFYGAGGDDSFYLGAALDSQDVIAGGDGYDYLRIDGDYSAGLTLGFFSLASIEAMSIGGGFDYKLTFDDNNIAAGENLIVYGSSLGVDDTLVFDGTAETNGSFNVSGGAGDDVIHGGQYDDDLSGYTGGNDKLYGEAGDDYISFEDEFTVADFVDGGDGDDRLTFRGDFGGPLTLGSAAIQNIESIGLGDAFSYHIIAQNSLVAAGKKLAVDTYYSPAGKTLYFDGSAEKDGSFELTGGDGNDTLIGGSQNDIFNLAKAGADTVIGGGGDDRISASSNFLASDKVDGGAGFDTLELYGDLWSTRIFQADTIKAVEQINLFYGDDYRLTMHDGNVAAGRILTIDGHFLGADDVVRIDGSAELDGRFTIMTGDGADVLTGGAGLDIFVSGGGDDVLHGGGGDDRFTGGHGRDIMSGELGADRFYFLDKEDTAVGANRDRITDFSFAEGDRIDLSAIDAVENVAGDQSFTFIGNAVFGGTAGELRYDLSGTHVVVAGDTDGDAAADFEILVQSLSSMAANNFVL